MKTLLRGVLFASIGFFGLVALGTGHVMAQAGHHDGHTSAAAGSKAAATGMSEGTVRRINSETGMVTIAHGPLSNLDMPPMTMTFRVTGETSLEGLASGDKVRFVADKDGDQFVVNAIEKYGD